MSTVPTNKNFLGQGGFKLVLDRTPHVSYFCQVAPLPGIQLSTIEMPSPIVTRPLPGTKLQFSPFDITFRIDEDMKNYIEIFHWLVGLGAPVSTEQRRLFEAGSRNNNMLSDGTLLIYSSKYNPNISVKFKDMFPENLSQVQFSTQGSDVDYLETSVSFRYSSFSIETL